MFVFQWATKIDKSDLNGGEKPKSNFEVGKTVNFVLLKYDANERKLTITDSNGKNYVYKNVTEDNSNKITEEYARKEKNGEKMTLWDLAVFAKRNRMNDIAKQTCDFIAQIMAEKEGKGTDESYRLQISNILWMQLMKTEQEQLIAAKERDADIGKKNNPFFS